ncbi:hypothetical protein B0T25DRAFT_58484 [Lasiosphaeria hispida]|uniref:Uncharacterized protein n=1 Tax=Lasiosphaeria hispida TaxID=260671 RepID=A0AAJ0MKT3_9PEZI|nr:hypothetical protein B0T25DRAFT_58484 [Lasiosphaeria hispida]
MAIQSTMERDKKCTTLAQLHMEAGQISNVERDQLKYSLHLHQERSLILACFSNHLGTVYCTSGTGTVGGWILDWGLAKLMTGRFSFTDINNNKYFHEVAPDKHFLYNQVTGHFLSCPGMPGEMVTPGEVMRGENHTVFKCGRTTGSTKGELNTIDSSVQMRYDFDDGSYEVVEGRALLVVSPSAHYLPCRIAIPFGSHGDSGSLVFDHQGRVLGLYIGRQTEDYEYNAPSIDGIYFISPIHPTLDAIRDATAKDPALQGQDIKVDFVWGPI